MHGAYRLLLNMWCSFVLACSRFLSQFIHVHEHVSSQQAEDELVEAKFSVKQLKAENISLSRRSDDSKDVSVCIYVCITWGGHVYQRAK